MSGKMIWRCDILVTRAFPGLSPIVTKPSWPTETIRATHLLSSGSRFQLDRISQESKQALKQGHTRKRLRLVCNGLTAAFLVIPNVLTRDLT